MIAIGLIVLGAGIGFYAFAGYPLLLLAAAALRRAPAPGARAGPDEPLLPHISITVPIYNEAHQLEELLRSLVALEYPEDRRQILIVSDGSTDGSDDIVRAWADRGVELLRAERGGKCAAENAARPHLTGEIIVNTDASIRIRSDALLPLVRPFSDPGVGVVSGRDLSVSGTEEDSNEGEAGYVGYEMWVRDIETRTGGIVGASGSFYATRSMLHGVEIPAELSRDFASALVAEDHGLAAVSAPEAVALVPRTGSLQSEYRRKVRTVARGMATLWAWRHLLNPLRHPSFAWKLTSHKLCRWALPFAAVLLLAGVTALASDHLWARVALALAFLAGAIGGTGWWLAARNPDRRLPALLSVPAFLLMSNVAVVHAFLRALAGRSQQLWEPTRRTSGSGAPGGRPS